MLHIAACVRSSVYIGGLSSGEVQNEREARPSRNAASTSGTVRRKTEANQLRIRTESLGRRATALFEGKSEVRERGCNSLGYEIRYMSNIYSNLKKTVDGHGTIIM